MPDTGFEEVIEMATKVASTDKYLWVIVLVNGFIWLRSGLEKVAAGNFIDSLSPTLLKFASNNPYPWFKDFLQGTAIPNASLFGLLTLVGEVFAGATIVAGSIYLLTEMKVKSRVILLLLKFGLVVGAFLNAVFYLAAGWMSPSTESLNLVMFATAAVSAMVVWRQLVGKTS